MLALALRRMQKDPLACVSERFERYGDIYHHRLLGTEFYELRHPDHMHEVLVNQATKFEKPRQGIAGAQLRRLLGEGLVTSNGDLWRHQRRLIQPAFRKEHLAEYAQWIVRHTDEMLAHWSDHGSVDVRHAMLELTLRIVCKTLFDHDASGTNDGVLSAMRGFGGAFGGVESMLPDWLITPARRRTMAALAQMDEIVYALIDRAGRPGSHDLISVLAPTIDAPNGCGMARRQLRDELLTLLIAGHETTGFALSWTLHLLASHPQIARRLEAEIDGVLGTRSPSLSDVMRLPYLEQVFSEALRLFPPAYVVARDVRADAEIGGYTIPRGACLVLWIYHVHHDARWFPDPDRFDPDRFSPEARRNMPACAFMPFGAGTRTCIGRNFAMLEAQLILLCILRRFRLHSTRQGPVERVTAMTLQPRGELRLRVQARAIDTREVSSPAARLAPAFAAS
jgi:cytochrome P450